MVEGRGALVHDAFHLGRTDGLGLVEEAHGLGRGPLEAAGVVNLEEEPVAAVGGDVQVGDGVVDAAGVMGHRQGAVDRADHLGQPAGFEARRHENEIGGPIGQAGQVFVKFADRHAPGEIMEADDVFEDRLVFAAGYEDDLQVLVPELGDDVVKGRRQQLAAFLDRVQARGPEKDRRPGIGDQPQPVLQKVLVGGLAGDVLGGAVAPVQGRVLHRVERRIGGVEDPQRTARMVLVADLALQRWGYEVVAALDDFPEEGRADGVDEVGREDPADQQVDGVLFAGLLVIVGHVVVEKVLPEIGRVDAAVFDLGEEGLHGVDVVDRKKARGAHLARHGRDQAGHPVVAVDQVRTHPGDDVVDHLALKGQRDFHVFPAVV